MAGPIKISILADATAASSSVTKFADNVSGNTGRVSDSFSETARRTRTASQETSDNFARATDGADEVDTKAMGFRDTLTGVQDTMKGTSLIAQGDLFNGFLTLGTGIGDLGSAFANFLIPVVKNMATAMKALNLTFLANPVVLIVLAIIALVTVLVIAYKKSETFRAIVDAVWKAIKDAVSGAIKFITEKIPKIWENAKEFFGRIPGFVSTQVERIVGFFKGLPAKILNTFVNANRILRDVGKRILNGLLDGLKDGYNKVKDFLSGLTNIIPSWKGPASRDKKLLTKNGQYIMDGFRKGLEGQYGAVRSSLTDFTDSLGASASTDVTLSAGVSGATSPTADRTETIVIKIGESTIGELIIDPLRKTIRSRGGLTAALGS